MVAVASIVGGALAAGGSVLGGSIAASGSRQAADLSRLVAQLTAQRLDPFRTAGENAGNMLSADLSSGRLGQPAPLTTAAIEDMPGYRFVRDQGLLATQNAQAAQGLGVSGPALAAAAQFATGLAANNFQNYFSDYWANQNNRFNMLYNLASLGENAAAMTGNQQTAGAANAGSALATAGANLGTGVSNAASTAGQNALLAGLLANRGGGSTGGGGLPPTMNPNDPTGFTPAYGVPTYGGYSVPA